MDLLDDIGSHFADCAEGLCRPPATGFVFAGWADAAGGV
jgi:hypothetical protein